MPPNQRHVTTRHISALRKALICKKWPVLRAIVAAYLQKMGPLGPFEAAPQFLIWKKCTVSALFPALMPSITASIPPHIRMYRTIDFIALIARYIRIQRNASR